MVAVAGHEAAETAVALGRTRWSSKAWGCAPIATVGPTLVQPRPRRGCRPTTLPRQREAELVARLDAGPTPADGVFALWADDVARILEAEFGVAYTLGGAYDLLHRLEYSCLIPRPWHEKADPAE